MRIISQGQRPEDKVHRGTCLNCKTVFEFEAREAEMHDDQRDGAALVINCPTCHQTVWVAP